MKRHLMGKKGLLAQTWRQLPFFVWLIALWMLLWGQFTVVAFLTGLIAAIIVTRVYRLPPVELSGRVNPWYGAIFLLTFLGALVKGSLTVAWQVLNPWHYPGVAVIAVPLDLDDELILAHTAVTASLIPGSLVVDIDRDRRVLYLHVIGVRSDADVESQRRSVLRWERRIVRAVGSRAQVAHLRTLAPIPRSSDPSSGDAVPSTGSGSGSSSVGSSGSGAGPSSGANSPSNGGGR
ncbi:Na+/H+ antiporter subunit E [Microbacterium sp. NPDC089189]|uniref:Na+/H+ antiporter subunit E n=1 Tax=Microbacterium sp. NPDC089189 TaxID=3154972 RepID=UPI003413B1C5